MVKLDCLHIHWTGLHWRVHSPKVVVKRTVSVDMMQEDVSLPFLLVDAGRTVGIHQPRIKGNYFFLHGHLLC